MTALADALAAHATTLVERAFAALYANPFWDARYGERGRRYTAEDSHYHVQYLVEALRGGSPETLVAYARWLQPLLTTRGMCSRHLAENFAYLAEAIRAEGLDPADEAQAYLDAAEGALRYDAGPARALQDAAPALAAAAAARLAVAPPPAAHPATTSSAASPAGAATIRPRLEDDLLDHIAYLADALTLDRPDLFANHVQWTASYLQARGVPTAALAARLDALDAALAALPPDTAAVARPVLASGRAALGAGAV
jgi:hypothetical protein